MTMRNGAAPPIAGDGVQANATSNRLLTPDEVAERWGVPKSQVYRLAREGRVPAVWIGRYVRFAPREVEAFEQAGGVSA